MENNSNEARYDVVRKFVREYARGTGRQYEVVIVDLCFQEAEVHKDSMNIYEIDDATDYFFVAPSNSYNN
jgi:hypothetical protein